MLVGAPIVVVIVVVPAPSLKIWNGDVIGAPEMLIVPGPMRPRERPALLMPPVTLSVAPAAAPMPASAPE